ncbi:MAG: hypothetical protein OHK0038_13850 [Flammeovirgaceae bacterium]
MKYLIICYLLAFSITSCYWDNEERLYPQLSNNCDTTNITYSGSVAPIINSSCNTCHNKQNANVLGSGIVLDDYNSLKARANTVLGSINHQSGFSPMPKNANKLISCQITIITKWVNAGMPNN